MATYIKALIDENGNVIYPQSKASAIYDKNNKNLQTTLDDIHTIVVSALEPTNQNTDDLWYKILD